MASGQGWSVDAEQIRAHAGSIDRVRAGFGPVNGASTNIAQNDAAYGLLCGWISGILEARHVRQDEIVAYVEENLRIAADLLRKTADAYEAADTDAESSMKGIEGRLPR
ncbi:hypothetical protein J2S43_002081 [Catenuloplanes nepalensis]|uniref:Excreted virulence factor EspC (Type VII ESX diderm) n=1 Tax=Catenuloplanes nepalensis TaxID=587533 RepID=A0ABT9MQ64_9ACTN|nr:type VII secretion target [Catenuloplanes nepalensis]MDP9793569.1 hypothetical protein [Catenuloplanes nepalensis]